MELAAAQQQFISLWSSVGVQWGISKTMAQVHAYLLVQVKPVNHDEMMQALGISRGNVHLNVHELVNWGLVRKVVVKGERKDYFEAEKDVYKMARIIARERKRRELQPVLDQLRELSVVEGEGEDKEHFEKLMREINRFGEQADFLLNRFIESESLRYIQILLKVFKRP